MTLKEILELVRKGTSVAESVAVLVHGIAEILRKLAGGPTINLVDHADELDEHTAAIIRDVLANTSGPERVQMSGPDFVVTGPCQAEPAMLGTEDPSGVRQVARSAPAAPECSGCPHVPPTDPAPSLDASQAEADDNKDPVA